MAVDKELERLIVEGLKPLRARVTECYDPLPPYNVTVDKGGQVLLDEYFNALEPEIIVAELRRKLGY